MDFFLWDLKIMNTEKHKEYTGVDNRLILDNLKKVDALAAVYQKDIYIRCVQIPQITDGERNLRDTVQFVKTLKRVRTLDLINYHPYGLKRYQALEREYPLKGAEPLADSVLKEKTAAGSGRRSPMQDIVVKINKNLGGAYEHERGN